MTKKELREKIEKLKEITYSMFKDAKTELYYNNNFQLLIAIIMSAQTTDKQVNKVNKVFFEVFKNPIDGIKLGEEKIKNYINSISFYKNKAKHIYKTCLILNEYNLYDYDNIEKLTKLNGVGIKTAKVFLAISRNSSYLGVDTHVHRVLNRVGIVKTKTPLETDKQAEKIFTTNDLSRLHHSLIMFGRYHCTARKPKCNDCKIKTYCNYYKKNNKT